MRLLLIDDDEVFVSVLSRALQRRGYPADFAYTGDQALYLLAHQDYAACVLDLRLQEESGLLLLPELLHKAPAMPVLILTAYASLATTVAAIKAGACNYLAKPAGAEEIIQALLPVAVDNTWPLAEQPMSVKRLEWEHLQKVLALHEGNISATARSLNMHRRTLQRKLGKKPVRT